MDFPKEILVVVETGEGRTLDSPVRHEFLVVVESLEDAAEAGEQVRVARYQLVEEGHVEAPPTFVPGPAR